MTVGPEQNTPMTIDEAIGEFLKVRQVFIAWINATKHLKIPAILIVGEGAAHDAIGTTGGLIQMLESALAVIRDRSLLDLPPEGTKQ